jgi:predicted nucleic-acid-binding Zn-ribbon protein
VYHKGKKVSGGIIVMEKKQFVCAKCGCTTYESDQFQATGGNFAKIFDIQNKKFITVSCTRCGYTELYKGTTSDGWNILDFLIGN